jgi:ferredoxin-NADP reductase
VRLPSACRAGACHSCLLRAESGDPGEQGSRGLRPTMVASGYFLACQARPVSDLRVAAAGRDVMTRAVLRARDWLSRDVLAVWLRPERPVTFRAGQHVTVDRGDGVVRVYSIANLPAEAARDGLELHVRVYPGGQMSEWLARAGPGTQVSIGTPAGECFYLPGDQAGPLLLAGTGTGIAPLLAIARDAVAAGHAGPVVMVHGAAEPSRLYLGERRQADGRHPGGRVPAGRYLAGLAGIRWRACARSRGEEIAEVAAAELAGLGDPAGTRAYLCGGRGTVAGLRRALFLAGVPLAGICADEFVPASGPAG